MSARPWRCDCGTLNASDAASAIDGTTCRRCGGGPTRAAPDTTERSPRRLRTSPRETEAAPSRLRPLPLLLLACALLAATRWDLVAEPLTAAHATPVDRARAAALRVAHLRAAADELAGMAAEVRDDPDVATTRGWDRRLDRLAARARLDGDRSAPRFARAEVSLRTALLELRSVRRPSGGASLDAPLADLRLRVTAAEAELQRATEDLAHAY